MTKTLVKLVQKTGSKYYMAYTAWDQECVDIRWDGKMKDWFVYQLGKPMSQTDYVLNVSTSIDDLGEACEDLAIDNYLTEEEEMLKEHYGCRRREEWVSEYNNLSDSKKLEYYLWMKLDNITKVAL